MASVSLFYGDVSAVEEYGGVCDGYGRKPLSRIESLSTMVEQSRISLLSNTKAMAGNV